MKDDFLDDLGQVTLIWEEMVEGHGEDSFYCAYDKDYALVSVFDGCGGLGSRTYEGLRGRTGAYIASRTVSGAIRNWCRSCHERSWTSPEEMTDSINQYIKAAYDTVRPFANTGLKISGSMVRDFPTTAAIAFAKPEKKGIALHVIWAGDSRVYLLDEDGLAQLTRDDVDSDDAMSNLSDDGALTNVLSSDGMYELHYKKQMLYKPTVVMAATDGCFGYVPSPMNFEYRVLECLDAAESFDMFEDNLREYFRDISGDDFTMGLLYFNFESYAKLRAITQERTQYMEQQYNAAFQEDVDETTLLKMWEKYKKNYERDLR